MIRGLMVEIKIKKLFARGIFLREVGRDDSHNMDIWNGVAA